MIARSAICLIAGLVLLLSLPDSAAGQITEAPWTEPAPSTEITDWSDEVPAHLSVVEGEAWLDRDGVNEAAAENTPLLAGDRLRTARGRIEVVFADGSALSFDEDSQAEFLSDTLLRLDRGRLRLNLARAGGAAGYRIDAAGTTVSIRAAGDYRVSLDARTAEPQVHLLVIRGVAELASSQERTLVRAGYEAAASAQTTPSLPYAVTVSNRDAFDRWTEARRDERIGYSTTRHLPAELSHYSGVLDTSGDWQYETAHGYVWYPRVDDGWQPYSAGRWSYVGSYGWTWTGGDRWSWPTHHYGRWGVSGQRYYWIPDRRWAPAWVAWGTSPGYVGWSPLGFDNRPLISVHVGYSDGRRGWNHAPLHGFSRTRVVIVNRNRYQPLPRNARFADGYRGPGRPAGVSVSNQRGLRGPSRAGRPSVAVARAPTRTNTNESRTPDRVAAPDRRTTPAADRRIVATPNRRTAGASDPRTSVTTQRADVQGRGAAAPAAQPGRSRAAEPTRRPETAIVPRTERAPLPSARARRVDPAPPASVNPGPSPSRSERVVAPRTDERRDRRAESEARYGVPTRIERGAPSPEPARQPAARPRAGYPASAPATRERPVTRERPAAAPQNNERTAAPSRVPRAEASRPAERQTPSAPASSGGSGRASARNRDR